MEQLATRIDILDDKEQQVFHRYLVDFKKAEFLLGRLLLKTQLAERLGISPQEIRFDKNKYGKLFLPDNYYKKYQEKVFFNLSHTNKMIVCAFTTLGEVGVDVEYTSKDHLKVMPNMYVEHEIAHVKAEQSQAEQFRAFYMLWTRKEAYIKARGMGFSLPPLTFTVPLKFGQAALKEWEYFTFQPIDDYLISTAIEKLFEVEISYHIQKLEYQKLLKLGREKTEAHEDF